MYNFTGVVFLVSFVLPSPPRSFCRSVLNYRLRNIVYSRGVYSLHNVDWFCLMSSYDMQVYVKWLIQSKYEHVFSAIPQICSLIILEHWLGKWRNGLVVFDNPGALVWWTECCVLVITETLLNGVKPQHKQHISDDQCVQLIYNGNNCMSVFKLLVAIKSKI